MDGADRGGGAPAGHQGEPRVTAAVRTVMDLCLTVYLSHLQESDYFTPQGEFRVDKAGSPTLLNCLMYKMSYYRFGEMQVRPKTLEVKDKEVQIITY